MNSCPTLRLRLARLCLWGLLSCTALALPACTQAPGSGGTDGGPGPVADLSMTLPGDEDLRGSGGGSDLSSTPPPDLRSPPTADEACQAQAAQSCTFTRDCFPSSFSYSYVDMAGCTAREKKRCLLEQALPGNAMTPTLRQRCTTAKSALTTCAQYYDDSYKITECQVPGTLTDGTACGAHAQCKSVYCQLDYSKTPACGTCQPYVKAGETCDYSVPNFRFCAPATACVGPAGAKKCTAAVPTGGACSADTWCLSQDACQSGKCQPRLGAGAACDRAVEPCDSTKSLQCSPMTNKCEKLFSYTAAGTACTVPATTYPANLCGLGSSCSTSFGTGTCIAQVNDGDACAAPPGTPGCLWPATCVSGRCTFPDPEVCK